MHVFGLTGGIASGKSAVAARLRARGVPVIDADELAREVVAKGTEGLAEVEYLDGEYHVVKPGSFVICAVTGTHIPLDALRYWSVDLQEAYASPEIATKRFRETGHTPK